MVKKKKRERENKRLRKKVEYREEIAKGKNG